MRWAPQLGVGQTRAPDNQSSNSLEVLVIADIEPDADKDGFGDETQDPCPTEAGPDTGCDPPETSITKGPKDKTRNKKAAFEFSAGGPGSTFECSLDSAAFSSCASGQVFKVRRVKHTLQVRATDAVGNVDGSPASDDWKVKRKRRK